MRKTRRRGKKIEAGKNFNTAGRASNSTKHAEN